MSEQTHHIREQEKNGEPLTLLDANARIHVKPQVFVCHNNKCKHFGEKRLVGPVPMGQDLYSHISNPFCVCGYETYQAKENGRV